jgi:hypothetical protein
MRFVGMYPDSHGKIRNKNYIFVGKLKREQDLGS